MITVLLQKIIDMLTDHFPAVITLLSKLNLIEEDTEEMRGNLDSMKTTLEDVDTQATTAAGKLTTIDTTLTAAAGNVASIKNNSDAIKNNILTMSTNVGNVAAYAQDTANNTLDIDQKITSIASDTTDIRTSNDDIYAESSKIYDAVKWLLSDKDIEETETDENSVSFDTDYTENLVKLDVGLTATQSGSGNPTPDNVRTISGYSNMGLTVNGQNVSIALGQTVYNGAVDVVNGVLKILTASILISDNSWTYNSQYGFMSTQSISEIRPTTNTEIAPLLMCECYTKGTAQQAGSGAINNTIAVSSRQLRIRDDNYDNTTSFVNDMGNYRIVYPLEVPIVITLTPEQITTIKGLNTISTDTNGEITVTYKESIKYYLDKND